MQKNSLRIDVLGTSFTIAAEEDALYLDGLLRRYKLKIEEIQKGAGIDDPLRVAILTGFALCDEIEKIRSGDAVGKSKYEYMRLGERLDNLSSHIDQVIGAKTPAEALPRVKSDRVFLLKNEFKHYDWGSTEWIPDLLGLENMDFRPWAEMWMGTHPAGPSKTDALAGIEPLKTVSGELPFLLKLLAAAKPLSIQAHPNLEAAVAGFARENGQGIPLDDPRRNYKDPCHKPEIICALTPFTAMAGFRERNKIVELLDAFACPALVPLRQKLRGDLSDEDAYRGFLEILFGMPPEQKDALSSYIARQIDEVKHRAAAYRKEWELIEEFQAFFPGETSVLAPLYLNVVELEPGAAMFIPSGILHAYVHGFGVELMSPSDNVLRGGLTKKFVDTAELLKILEPRAFTPSVLKPVPVNFAFAAYPAPVKDWTLAVIASSGGRKEHFPEPNASIIIVTEGRLTVSFFDGHGGLSLERGESVFLPPAIDRGSFCFEGTFTAYAACAAQLPSFAAPLTGMPSSPQTL